ncbi:MAG TPA: ATP-binding protein [Jiangellaceae bacterium]
MGHGQWSHATALPSEPGSVSRARHFVFSRLVQHRLPHLVDDVQLVASELAANAVRHARTPFKVILEKADDSVKLSVEDGSPSRPAQVATDDLDTTGRGVSIVELVSHDWGVADGPGEGKSVWATFATR